MSIYHPVVVEMQGFILLLSRVSSALKKSGQLKTKLFLPVVLVESPLAITIRVIRIPSSRTAAQRRGDATRDNVPPTKRE